MSPPNLSFVVNNGGFYLQSHLTPQPGGVRVYAHLWHGVIDLQWDNKTSPIPVYAEAETNETSPSLKQQWTEFMRCGSAIAIQNAPLKPFSRNNISEYLPNECNGQPASWTVPITDAYLAELEKAYERDQKGRLSFRIALERARSLGKHSPQPGEKNGAYAMLSFLQWSLNAGDPNPYNRVERSNSDLNAARSAMSDLSRRKNTRHDGYKSSQDSVSWSWGAFHRQLHGATIRRVLMLSCFPYPERKTLAWVFSVTSINGLRNMAVRPFFASV